MEVRDYEQPTKKRCFIRYDRAGAAKCIQRDYLGPNPIFDDKQFQRMFRITKGVYNVIKNEAVQFSPFFSDTIRFDAVGKAPIATDAKILIALKYLAYGKSLNAFRDYFQMGERTALKCLHELIHVISQSELLKSIYL